MPETVLKSLVEHVVVLKWVIGGLATAGTLLVGNLYHGLNRIAERQGAHEVEVAQKYASKQDLKEVKDDIIREMKSGFSHQAELIKKEKYHD